MGTDRSCKCNIFSWIIVLIFLGTISTPLVVTCFQEDKLLSSTEKRPLAQFPPLPDDTKTVQQYPRELERYFNDQFGLREFFLHAFSRLKELIGDTEINSSQGKVPTENTVRGKNGWFFLNRVWDGDPIADYRNISLYSEVDLLRATFIFAARNDWLRRHGARYLLFFAPNKHTVYAEYMPDYIVKQGQISSMDQLYEALARYTSVPFVDLRNVLQKGKKDAHLYWKNRKEEAALYYKKDSHWNAAGADLVQFAVARRLEKMFPGLIIPEKRPLEDFTMLGFTGDISLIMGRKDEEAYGPHITGGRCTTATTEELAKRQLVTTCATGKLNALIFHDSFFTIPLKAFFADYFAKTTFLWQSMSQQAFLDQLQQGRIDVVIEERAERFLPMIPDITHERYDAFWGTHFPFWKKIIFSFAGQIDTKNRQFTTHDMELTPRTFRNAALRVTGDTPGLALTEIPFAENHLYMLYLEINSPEDTTLKLFYSSKDQAVEFPDSKHVYDFLIKKGENTLYVPLFSGHLGDRLLLVPGTDAEKYTVKKLEIREVDISSFSHVQEK
jgi:hypothetical protein